ncbi:MAG: hypothetical protein R6V44_09975 [Paracoccaceae bacterium]
MRRTTLLALIVFAAPAAAQSPDWTPPPAKDGHRYPDCYCTNRGVRVEMGRTACLRIGSEDRLARCEMSLNSPTWRTLQEGCPPPGPSSSLQPSLDRLQPG